MLFIIVLIILFFLYIEQFIQFKEKPKGYNKDLECKTKFNRLYKNIPYYVKLYTIPKIIPKKKYNNPYIEITKKEFNKLLILIIHEDKKNFPKNIEKFYEKNNYIYDYYNGLKSYKLDNMLILSLVNYITNRINKKMIDKKYTKNIVNGYFTIKNFQVINVYENKIGELKFLLKMLICRKTKKTCFEILCEIIINNDKKYKIIDINIIGNTTLDNISSIKPYKKTDKIFNIYRNYPNIKRFNYKNYYRDNDKNNFLYIPNNNKLIKNIKKKKKEFIDIRSFRCFRGKYSNITKEICENDKYVDGIKYKKRGVWDKLCKNNQECPFYKANKNYPNNFGGCVNGFCELPINMVNISPRLYSYKSGYKPFCYNCMNNTYNCCPTQNNKKLYPRLITPDYAFPNDINVRYKYMNILKKKGLDYNRIIGKK